MIKVSVFYPNQPGKHFDIDYYCVKHIPMVQRLLGSALLKVAVEQGVSGTPPGTPPTYLAMGHLYFESVASFEKAFGPHFEQIRGDVPNYTNSPPVIQISEVRI